MGSWVGMWGGVGCPVRFIFQINIIPKVLFNVCSCFACMYAFAPSTVPTRSEEGIDPLQLEFTESCEPPYGCWELSSGPLEEQQLSYPLSHLSTNLFLALISYEILAIKCIFCVAIVSCFLFGRCPVHKTLWDFWPSFGMYILPPESNSVHVCLLENSSLEWSFPCSQRVPELEVSLTNPVSCLIPA